MAEKQEPGKEPSKNKDAMGEERDSQKDDLSKKGTSEPRTSESDVSSSGLPMSSAEEAGASGGRSDGTCKTSVRDTSQARDPAKSGSSSMGASSGQKTLIDENPLLAGMLWNTPKPSASSSGQGNGSSLADENPMLSGMLQPAPPVVFGEDAIILETDEEEKKAFGKCTMTIRDIGPPRQLRPRPPPLSEIRSESFEEAAREVGEFPVQEKDSVVPDIDDQVPKPVSPPEEVSTESSSSVGSPPVGTSTGDSESNEAVQIQEVSTSVSRQPAQTESLSVSQAARETEASPERTVEGSGNLGLQQGATGVEESPESGSGVKRHMGSEEGQSSSRDQGLLCSPMKKLATASPCKTSPRKEDPKKKDEKEEE